MTEIQEMFLKAADFRIIERQPLRLYPGLAIGCRFNSAGRDFGSYMFEVDESDREEVSSMLKEIALNHILSRIGCHA